MPNLRVRLVAPARTVQSPPIVSQRYHWYASRTLPEPVQVPGEARRRSPSVGRPDTVGRADGVGPPVAPGVAEADAASAIALAPTARASSGTRSRRARLRSEGATDPPVKGMRDSVLRYGRSSPRRLA